jgi:adenylate kinase family enzyme
MRKILLFGNSGSGKSTLAKELCETEGLPHLDLDTLAWLPTSPPQRQLISDSEKAMQDFTHGKDSWIIEGCYTDLLECVAPFANEIVFMDLPIEACVSNARGRPWEPHKYVSKEAQDANLENLIEWIAQYRHRTDTFSEQSHRRFYNDFQGKKITYTSNRKRQD